MALSPPKTKTWHKTPCISPLPVPLARASSYYSTTLIAVITSTSVQTTATLPGRVAVMLLLTTRPRLVRTASASIAAPPPFFPARGASSPHAEGKWKREWVERVAVVQGSIKSRSPAACRRVSDRPSVGAEDDRAPSAHVGAAPLLGVVALEGLLENDGGPRVWSHCRFRDRCTEYVRKTSIKWMSGSTKRHCDRARGGPAEDAAHIRDKRRVLAGVGESVV